MPIIRIDFDNEKVSEEEILGLTKSAQKIVSETTGIEDVFVYADSPQIKFKIAPIEVFVEMSTDKIKDLDELMNEVKSKLSQWKKENNFSHPINLTIIPMSWRIAINI